jgi:PEP-CTERM motif
MSRFGKLMLRSGLSVAAMCMAGSATAAEYLITYTGTVRNSVDLTGVFGGSGNSLNGLSFTAVFTLTDPNPGGQILTDGMTFRQSSGGTSLGNTPSPLSAFLNINGVTQQIDGTYSGLAGQRHNYFGQQYAVQHDALSGTNNITGDFFYRQLRLSVVSLTDFTHGINLTAPLSYSFNPNPNDFGFGRFDFAQSHDNRQSFVYAASGELLATSVTIAALGTGAVPEPASWMLMIAGFGLVGGAMRRGKGRQRQQAQIAHAG